MLNSRYFDQQLVEQIGWLSGVPVVAVHLNTGMSYHVRSVDRAEHGYVLLEVHQQGAAAGPRAEKLALPYEAISHVVVGTADAEQAGTIGFGAAR